MRRKSEAGTGATKPPEQAADVCLKRTYGQSPCSRILECRLSLAQMKCMGHMFSSKWKLDVTEAGAMLPASIHDAANKLTEKLVVWDEGLVVWGESTLTK